MDRKSLPIGVSDFQKLIENELYYIDKTLFIKELLSSKAEVTLIVRPRRFGKTLNMSMLKVFFEKNDTSKGHLFKNLAVQQHADCMDYQGKYPVIFFGFKDTKKSNWELSYQEFKNNISQEFLRHKYVLAGTALEEFEKKQFISVVDKSADDSLYQAALRDLSMYLFRYHKVKPIVLIDEYDAAIYEGFYRNYYDEIITFMRNFLSAGLKDNNSLSFAVMTGILRVAKESIFSGLNNLRVCTMLQDFYTDKFGLLEYEVEAALQTYKMDNKIDSVRRWYNGYHVGKTERVYNPWSILNLIDNKGAEGHYWINTSDNSAVRDIIENADDEMRGDFERLMAGESISKQIYENIVFAQVSQNNDAVWSFLLQTGYLTFEKSGIIGRGLFADLRIPNEEVHYIFETVVIEWMKRSSSNKRYTQLLDALSRGDTKMFISLFMRFVDESFSFFDTGEKKAEDFYHGFTLGMLAGLASTHEVRSNRESGYGRYDVMVIPKDTKKTGYIFEFKKVDTEKKETLKKAADSALKQIQERDYAREMRSRGISVIAQLGIAFEGKKVCVVSQ